MHKPALAWQVAGLGGGAGRGGLAGGRRALVRARVRRILVGTGPGVRSAGAGARTSQRSASRRGHRLASGGAECAVTPVTLDMRSVICFAGAEVTSPFTRSLLQGYNKINGTISLILGIGIALIVWIWGPLTQISLPWALLLAIPIFVLVLSLTVALCDALESQSRPRVKSCVRTEHKVLLLTEPSTWFVIGSLVSIHCRQEEFEMPLAQGRVVHIQTDGLTQILIERLSGEARKSEPSLISRIEANDVVVLRSIIVRPHFLQSIEEE